MNETVSKPDQLTPTGAERELLLTAGRILIIDPDLQRGHALAGALGRGAVVESVSDLVHHDVSAFELVLCALEQRLGTGMDVLTYLRHSHPNGGVVLYSARLEESVVREAFDNGALDMLEQSGDFLSLLPGHVMRAAARLKAELRVRRMKRDLHRAMGTLADELSVLQSRLNQLETLAVTDELTGLHNRRFMNTALDDLWRGVRADEATLGCMIIDIDRFKDLNDRFGHQSGDAALYVLGQVLRENCRKTDIITRYGGDEFCVLMPDIQLLDAVEIARRIDAAFREVSAALLQDEFELGLSIGVSVSALSRPRSALQLVAHADEAMYAAKREGEPVRARGEAGVIAA